MTTLKEQKEAFVTGHSGSTPGEVLLVCFSAPVGIFLFNEIQRSTKVLFGTNRPFLVAVESLVLLLPMAICQTSLLYPYGVALLGIEFILAFCLNFLSSAGTKRNCETNDSNKNGKAKKPKLPFLTAYRSTVSYLTFVAILAVDFYVFPRRFAKTETTGYGLMDLGAGSFIVSGGFVSWYARRSATSTSTSAQTVTASYWETIKPTLIRSIPLIVMGMIRLLTTKGLEYQEHVSEYGVHWNFFFTLTVVGIASTMARFDSLQILGPGNFKAYPWLLLVFHQAALSKYGMQTYIEEGGRQCAEKTSVVCNVFAANREGILGCVGYLSMFFISEDIAQYCIWDERFAKTPSQRGKRLSICCSILWAALWVLVSVLEIPVSRRSTNATFVIWTLAHNVTILLMMWIAFSLTNGSSVSPIFDAVNRHGLIVFILANLMTGLVNITINTLEVADGQALGVIFVYLFAVGSVALTVDWTLRSLLPARPKTKDE
mmetsp:Transcript_10528/g.29603  ORF Transcript_10528/g.29603 Transcript_10528/m.29603 type:complete len:487 (-) Transcript_10528:1553-3013(-)|eukprot:CAMPEP_0197725754 /NCGR_PEP_ID=MMETSP1434-20131217/10202_1 /TAXON_ID=265543 /ORGANISM="Minutocellus polymorphus, Strain CCMP3303" /LENGTH=486 /DNA_ID=CAMNT_0043311405 /DNA_START=52 /DNA_END=1512 /DNA_ORIENTATION=-